VHSDPLPVQWAAKRAVVTLPEHIDAANAGQVREQLLGLINQGATVLVADMTGTVSCDHGGADALVRAYHRASANGTRLRVAVTSPLVRRILAASGLDRLVSMYPSLEAALAARAPQAAGPAQDSSPDGDHPGAAAITPAVLRSLLDALADGIALVTSDGDLALVSQRTEDMFGYPAGELAGQRVEALIPADLRAAHGGYRAGYQQQPVARPMGGRARLVGLRKDGSTFPVQVTLSPVPTATGHLTLAVIRDITAIPPLADLASLARAAAATAGREHRSRDFLDRVVNRLYHVGLSLHDAPGLPHDLATQRIADAVQRLDDLIIEIRDHVFAGHDDPPGTPPPNGSR
jgi:anti-anti-sigma factor